MRLIMVFAAAAICAGLSGGPSAAAQSRLDRAPEIVGTTWLNTKDGHPVTLQSRKGKPTLVAFWTFACENCQNNMRPYARLLARFRSKGVEMISVHTPELPIERDLSQVSAHVRQLKIDYPVVIDNDSRNWDRWHVGVWPSLYVVDGDGNVRYHWFGELNYNNAAGEAKIAEVLDQLLAEK